ncbi:MAG: hypothetical protein UY61_C0086G0008 [Candidatus Adlerbacteria bacterium GW2011_GWC1_50_9]|uniref:Uncharacterized protein n=1 Tax=Candidatus Adlerbacteria bacterium GW2011_GWC1_50_9 TaxID=1618608 RepID=A0A0G1WHQ4_9BACT|nr:MAG: hypothetical protein UY61_C0086G0008 [Candidatus Adlerbacteria bacterium GW2011_GWC1_50_9]
MYTLGKQARALFFLYALAFAIISTAPFFVSAETMEERRLRLESELAVIEQDIVEKRGGKRYDFAISRSRRFATE